MDRRGLHLHGLPAGRSFQTDKQPEKISGHETSLITTLGPFYYTPALDNRHPACWQNNRRQPGEPLNASDTTIAISSFLLFLRTSPRKKSDITQVLLLLSDKHNYIDLIFLVFIRYYCYKLQRMRRSEVAGNI
jgi:hypothetical protein